MDKIKTILYLIVILTFSIVYCNARKSKESAVKRDCIPPGGLCKSREECCGYEDPNVGHCVVCENHDLIVVNWGRTRCGCDVTGSVAIDRNTNAVISDMCHGRNAARTGCATRVAPASHRNYRGKQ